MGLKQRLIIYYEEQRHDFDEEETDNVLEILRGYNEDLDGLNKTDHLLLGRMIQEDDSGEELQLELDYLMEDFDDFDEIDRFWNDDE